MTFKHVKFEDSPTMRALEKVAKEKGLVKPEPLQKKASVTKKADYTPSDDFMENIFKLCAGLRANGLEKAATEVEINYLRYKQAQTLYETSKEKGEDLVQAAHPKGSHKLEGVEGNELAVVEDILDQHTKLVEIVNKKPTGKLSSAQVINEVKRALGQLVAPKESESELYESMNTRLNDILAYLGTVLSVLKNDGGPDFNSKMADKGAAAIRSAVAARPFTRNDLRNALLGLKQLQSTSSSGDFKTSNWFGSPDNDDPGVLNWNKPNGAGTVMGVLVSKINSLDNVLRKLDTIRIMKEQGIYKGTEGPSGQKGQLTIAPVTIQEGPLGPVYRQINSLQLQLNTWSTYRSISSDPEAAKWISDEIKELDGIKARMDKVPENEEAEKEAAPNFQREVDQEKAGINEFKTGWVDQK